MEGSGVCVACGASGVELNVEGKCTTCAATPAPEAAPAPEAPAEGGDMPAAE